MSERINFKSRYFLNLKNDKNSFKHDKLRSSYYVYLYSVSTYNFFKSFQKFLKGKFY